MSATLWERIMAALGDCAAELASEVECRYAATKDRPAMTWRYERDMESVVHARALLAEMERVECVEGASTAGPGPLGYGFLGGPMENGERPALLLLLPEDR